MFLDGAFLDFSYLLDITIPYEFGIGRVDSRNCPKILLRNLRKFLKRMTVNEYDLLRAQKYYKGYCGLIQELEVVVGGYSEPFLSEIYLFFKYEIECMLPRFSSDSKTSKSFQDS